jgi:hypothetical protein
MDIRCLAQEQTPKTALQHIRATFAPFTSATLNPYPSQDMKPISDIYFWLQYPAEQPLQGQVLRSPRLAAKAAGDLPRLRALY